MPQLRPTDGTTPHKEGHRLLIRMQADVAQRAQYQAQEAGLQHSEGNMEQIVILEPGTDEAVSGELDLEAGVLYWLGLYVSEGELPKELVLEIQTKTKTPGAWLTTSRVTATWGSTGSRLIGGEGTRVRRPATSKPFGVYLQRLVVEQTTIKLESAG